MDGWKTICSFRFCFGAKGLFSGVNSLLVFGKIRFIEKKLGGGRDVTHLRFKKIPGERWQGVKANSEKRSRIVSLF